MKKYNKPALEVVEAAPVQIIAESILEIDKTGTNKLDEDEILTQEDKGFWDTEW